MNRTNLHFEKYLVYLLVLLTPVVVLASFTNAFTTPKMAFVTFILGLVLVVKALRSIIRNGVSFSASGFDLPVFLVGGAYIVSSIVVSPNLMDAYFSPGIATIVIAGVVLFFVINQLGKEDKGLVRYMLFSSGILVAIAILLSTAGIFKSQAFPQFMQADAFNTLGGPLPALIYLVAIAPLGISLVLSQGEIIKKVFGGVALSIVVLAALISLINILPGRATAPLLPGFNNSWVVAVDSLKQSPLLGIGPGNYLTAFNVFRPLEYNTTDLWATRFTTSQSFLLTAVTETGVVGAAALIMVFLGIIKTARGLSTRDPREWFSSENAPLVSIILLSVALITLPESPTLILAFFVLLALISKANSVNLGMINMPHEHGRQVPFAARIPTLLVTVPMLVFVAFYGLNAARVLAADVSYRRALNYITENNGTQAYETLQNAINGNLFVDRYRVTYSQVNLALANSLAENEELTEEDRNNIGILIQQAIREGQVAISLNPQRAANWENLGTIYRAIMPLAEGADAFAVQTFNQAVALDPFNPNMRISLGGIFYSAGAYDNAIEIFRLAVRVKPDLANAHYNLAIAYREAGDIDLAIESMSNVLSLVDRESNDYELATQVLEDLQERRASTLPESDGLTPPPAGDQTGQQPILELPAESAPPQIDNILPGNNEETPLP